MRDTATTPRYLVALVLSTALAGCDLLTISPELLAEHTGRVAFGRAAEPWEVANVMVFLASDYSSYLTGEVLSVSSQHA